MCRTPCIVKIIATEDERYREVDVCQMCGAMYPHEGKAAAARPVSKSLPRPRRPRGKVKPGKKAKKAKKPKKRKAKAKPRKKAARKAKKRPARRR